MRKRGIAVMLLCAALALTACGWDEEVENQAYVLALGIDRADDGALVLTALIPRIGKGAKDEKPADGDYLTFTARGESWPMALEALRWTVPREVNLSHIKLLAVSQSLASEADFGDLLIKVAEIRHLYSTARLVVTGDGAGELIHALHPVIGSRLSVEIDATLRHLTDLGYIPESTLADVYYAMKSIFPDAIAAMGFTSVGLDGQIRCDYAGTALFSGGHLVHTLDARDTQWLNLIIGTTPPIPFSWQGREVELIRSESPRLSVDWQNGAPTLTVAVKLSTSGELPSDAAEAAEASVLAGISGLIGECQARGVDPFGFGLRAAASFMTADDWLKYDWPRQFVAASVEVDVMVAHSEN